MQTTSSCRRPRRRRLLLLLSLALARGVRRPSPRARPPLFPSSQRCPFPPIPHKPFVEQSSRLSIEARVPLEDVLHVYRPLVWQRPSSRSRDSPAEESVPEVVAVLPRAGEGPAGEGGGKGSVLDGFGVIVFGGDRCHKFRIERVVGGGGR
jgi:hypothetical protein